METNLSEKLLLADRSRFVQRWTGFHTVDRSNISEHTFRVSYFSKLLIEELNNRFNLGSSFYSSLIAESLFYAMIHDLGEVFTGDVGHIIKRNHGIKEKLDLIEDIELNKCINTSSISGDIYIYNLSKIVVKIADLVDVIFEGLKEKSLGNTISEFEKAIYRGEFLISSMGNSSSSEKISFLSKVGIKFSTELKNTFNFVENEELKLETINSFGLDYGKSETDLTKNKE